MTEPRLASGILVSALIRQVEGRGGNGMVLFKGDAIAGGVLVTIADRGRPVRLLERVHDFDGRQKWQPVGPQDIENTEEFSNYLARRRRIDPDIWVIELDIADGERFADEMTGAG